MLLCYEKSQMKKRNKQLYPLMHNAPKWSNPLQKSYSIFKVFDHFGTLCIKELIFTSSRPCRYA